MMVDYIAQVNQERWNHRQAKILRGISHGRPITARFNISIAGKGLLNHFFPSRVITFQKTFHACRMDVHTCGKIFANTKKDFSVLLRNPQSFSDLHRNIKVVLLNHHSKTAVNLEEELKVGEKKSIVTSLYFGHGNYLSALSYGNLRITQAKTEEVAYKNILCTKITWKVKYPKIHHSGIVESDICDYSFPDYMRVLQNPERAHDLQTDSVTSWKEKTFTIWYTNQVSMSKKTYHQLINVLSSSDSTFRVVRYLLGRDELLCETYGYPLKLTIPIGSGHVAKIELEVESLQEQPPSPKDDYWCIPFPYDIVSRAHASEHISKEIQHMLFTG
eukprot:CAMPEP_0115023546 /NCGR_PEP_ID=MMETSP0216-20121206/32482_1 /TAXON_ID=223996 /ORGANISM="Protocruzia adherens, Strain Boccale" /LENGTH=330 /DNA_ID=CAMNT_0002396985 /DNA_START=592 /DNA_END=1584 /DNA_ORIENTATION=-